MRTFIFILLLTIIGGIFRFYNLDWDSGYFFHPDERNIANAVTRINFFDQLNPGFFAYGGFLIYLYRASADFLVFLTKNNLWTYDWGQVNLIGRFYSALFSTLTIPLIFFLAGKIFNRTVAIIAVLLSAFTVSFIQTAHFAITENFLILSVVITTLSCIHIFEKSILRNYLKTGVILGLTSATKMTGLSFVIIPLVTFLFKRKFSFKNLLQLISLILSAILIFIFFSPYTFLSWDKFIESMRYESGVALGSLSVPYTLQFAKTIPYLFQIKNLFWQMGPVAFFGLIGFILLTINAIKTNNIKLVIFISFPLFYFLYVGSWYTKFIRFMLPLLPFLIISSAWLLFKIKERLKTSGSTLIVVFCLLTFLWALAFFSIYTREQTRISSSIWIYKNISDNSKILAEHWDDGLPVTLLTGGNPSKYRIEQLKIYEPDNQGKIDYYAEKLSGADYIVISSRRLYGTLINLPEKYPTTSRYYKLLFNNQLGYEEVVEFSSYPSILGLEINDDKSEETFQVYDHPKIIIFKNLSKFSEKEIKSKLEL